MKLIRPLLATAVLAIWMFIACAVTAYIGGILTSIYGIEGYSDLERSLGGITIPLTGNAKMHILWFNIVVFFPVFLLMAAPAVWLLQGKK